MSAQRPRYDVTARSDCELYWSSYVFCGLFDLAEQGMVRIRFAPPASLPPREILGTALAVTDLESGECRRLAIDWRDNANILCRRKLQECDVYLKRNLIPEVTRSICSDEDWKKIRPAGLSFAVRGNRERPYWVRAIGGLFGRESPVFAGTVRQTYRRLRSAFVRSPRRATTLRREADFESPDLEGARNVVLYQTRAYDPAGSGYPDDTRLVNEERARIIRFLRKALGERFVGGFAANDYVRTHYPDCASPHDSSERGFCGLIRTSRVCVYSRGLRDSPAFKLAEYLAAGRAILADPIRTRLPAPLVDGRHLLHFQTDQQLLDLCERLLDDEALQSELSREARRYYEAHVKPKNAVLRYLRQTFEVSEPAGERETPSEAAWA